MRFVLGITTDNAAFQDAEEDRSDEEQRNQEVARILEHVAKRLRQGVITGMCMDLNGNNVGGWGYE